MSTIRSAGNSMLLILLFTNQACMSSMLSILILPFGLRAGQGYLCSSSGRVSGPDREIKEGLPVRAAVIGLAVVADGTQIGDVVIAHELPVGLGEIRIDHA